jgi:hypothetical protein
MKEWEEKKKQYKNLKSDIDDLQGDILAVGKAEWLKLYEKMQRNPESFRLKSEDGSAVLVMPKDQYIKISDERAEELKAKYGEKIVNEQTKVSFNDELLNQFGEVISNVLNSEEFRKKTGMTQEQVDALFVFETSIGVKKGAIDEAFTTGEGKVEDYITDINPVVALK